MERKLAKKNILDVRYLSSRRQYMKNLSIKSAKLETLLLFGLNYHYSHTVPIIKQRHLGKVKQYNESKPHPFVLSNQPR